jgi:hypothetical protein
VTVFPAIVSPESGDQSINHRSDISLIYQRYSLDGAGSTGLAAVWLLTGAPLETALTIVPPLLASERRSFFFFGTLRERELCRDDTPAQESKSGMTPAESAAWYRENAAMCVAIAQRTSDAAKKLLLLQMAQDWANLAEELLKLEECATRNAGSHRGKCH